MKIKVGVIFGGPTVEHEVSIISAVQAMSHLDEEKYEIVPIYVTKDRKWYTGSMLKEIDVYKDMDLMKRYAKEVTLYHKNGEFVLQSLSFLKRIVNTIDIAFPIVHGNNMEDGTIAGYLKMIGIPTVGSSVLGSALGQDKIVMKQVFEASGLPIVDYTWFYDSEYLLHKTEIFKDVKKIGYPVLVKPASLGSSVGIKYVKDELDLDAAIQESIQYDHKVVIEKAVENLVEVNCSVLGNYDYQKTSVIEEVMGADEFLSYQDKYLGGGKGKIKGSKGMASTNRIVPARISPEMTSKVEELSKIAFKALNLTGVCRIDFLIDKKHEKVYINEPNTIPGSLSFYLWEPMGKPYRELLDDMITLAIKEYKNEAKKITSFESNILSNYNGSKGVKGSKLKR